MQSKPCQTFVLLEFQDRYRDKMSNDANTTQKTYHKKATGAALNTVKKHSKEHDLKLYGSCFW